MTEKEMEEYFKQISSLNKAELDKTEDHRLTVRIPPDMMQDMERKRKKCRLSYNAYILQAIDDYNNK